MLRSWILGLSLTALAIDPGSIARAAAPTVESVVPAIGRRGTTFTVSLIGGRLGRPDELVFYEPGLACRGLEPVSENEVRATLEAAADCRLGLHAFRLRSPGGLSELRVVQVGPLPVVAEVEPNDDRRAAQPVPLNASVAGVVDSGDTDVFALTLREGQRLSAEVQAVRLGGEMTDTLIQVYAPDGRLLAAADDTPITRQDPSLSLVAPQAGTYHVLVRETSFGGGPTGTYALHVGDFLRPASAFPPGGEAGRPGRLTLTDSEGRAVDLPLAPPADAGPWWDFFPTVDGRTSPTPVALRVRPFAGVVEPDLAETDPDSVGTVCPRDWPVAFEGAIAGAGDRDAFAFSARAGEPIQVEAFAYRVGSRLDPVLEVFDPEGRPVARNDDDQSHDSRLSFRARADGAYRVAIADKRGQGGPLHHYRIEVDHPRPGLSVFLLGPARKTQAGQVIAVPRGNRVTAYLGVRRDGFEGPVRIEPAMLPPGVTVDLEEIPAGTYLTPVVLEAAADAAPGAVLTEVRGLATTPAGSVRGGFEQVVDLLPAIGDSSYQSVTVDRLAVVVTEEAPYRVSLGRPPAPLARDGAIELVATVERSAGFEGPVEVSMPLLPPGVEMEGPVVVPPGETQARLTLLARPDAEPVAWRLSAEARPAAPRRDRREMTLALSAQIGAGRRPRPVEEGLPPVASAFVPLELVAGSHSGRFVPAAVEQGQTTTVACLLESEGDRPGPLTATLEGLPPRAEAGPVVVEPGQRSVSFTVKADPTTPVGDHATLVCRLSGAVDGRQVVHRIGRVGRLKVTPPGAIAVDADGKPLSPLDALRRRGRAGLDAATTTEPTPDRP